MAEITAYQLSRSFWDFSFENPEKISPNHAAIFFFAIEHCNRLGWKKKFGFPTQMAMDAVGISKHQTYIRYFYDLCEWGFFTLIQRSQNQYSANIISLSTGMLKNGKALDKAFINHAAKQTETNGQSNSSIDKPDNQITNKQDNKEEIKNSIFQDVAFMTSLEKSNKGKDFEDAFDQCWLHFSQLPSPLHDWQWRQKFSSWLTNYTPTKKIKKGGFVQ